MKANSLCIVLLVFICALAACRRVKPLVRDEYVKWVQNEKNGLRKVKVIGDIEMMIQYKPIEYVALREYNNDGVEKFEKLCNEYRGMQYYDITIDVVNDNKTFLKYKLNSSDDFYQRLNYFSFQAKKDISLEENGKSVPNKLYHFERSYDLTRHSTILLGFPEEKGHESDSRTIVFDATKLGLGIIKIEIEGSDLKNIPQVKL